MDCKKFYFWLKNILGICFWVLLANYWFFKIDFLNNFFKTIYFFVNNYCFYLLTGICLVFIFLLIIKKEKIIINFLGIIFFVFYIIIYPFIKLFNIIFKFIINLYFFDSVVIKNLLHIILFFPLFLLLYSAIVTFKNIYILFASVFALIICMFFYQLYLLYWFNDSNLFIKIPSMILNDYSKKDWTFQHYISKSHFMILVKLLLNRRLWFFIFLIIFVFALFLNTITFSFVYFGLSKIDKSSFSGIEKVNFINHFYFTASNFSTIKISNTLPMSQFAKISVLLQIISAIFLFSIILISFSFTSSDDSEEERKKLIEMANSELKNIKMSLKLPENAKDIDLLRFIIKKRKNKK